MSTPLRATIAALAAFSAWSLPLSAGAASTCKNQWLLTGSASMPTEQDPRSEGALWLTQGYPEQTGSAWCTSQTLDVSQPFEIAFQFTILGENDYRHSGGLALVVQGHRPDAIGRGADGLGFAGIPQSIAFTIDSWGKDFESIQGPESACFVSRGPLENEIDAKLVCAKKSDSGNFTSIAITQVHYAEISYDGLNLVANIDNKYMPLINVGNLHEFLGLMPGASAWIGFTGTTGLQSFDIYEIRDLYFANTPAEPYSK